MLALKTFDENGGCHTETVATAAAEAMDTASDRCSLSSDGEEEEFVDGCYFDPVRHFRVDDASSGEEEEEDDDDDPYGMISPRDCDASLNALPPCRAVMLARPLFHYLRKLRSRYNANQSSVFAFGPVEVTSPSQKQQQPKRKGFLYTVAGPMFAGKTLRLLQALTFYHTNVFAGEERKNRCYVIKLAGSERFGEKANQLVSRAGFACEAVPVERDTIFNQIGEIIKLDP
jgi:hypothetical protein